MKLNKSDIIEICAYLCYKRQVGVARNKAYRYHEDMGGKEAL